MAAVSIRKLKKTDISQLEHLLKNELMFSKFCITKNKKLKCTECLLELNYRDVDILKRHLKSVRHLTIKKLNKFETFYNLWIDN